MLLKEGGTCELFVASGLSWLQEGFRADVFAAGGVVLSSGEDGETSENPQQPHTSLASSPSTTASSPNDAPLETTSALINQSCIKKLQEGQTLAPRVDNGK